MKSKGMRLDKAVYCNAVRALGHLTPSSPDFSSDINTITINFDNSWKDVISCLNEGKILIVSSGKIILDIYHNLGTIITLKINIFESPTLDNIIEIIFNFKTFT